MSRSGKSTLSLQLAISLAGQFDHVPIISQDDYCLPSHLLPLINGRPDWEHLDSVDWDKLHEAIHRASMSAKMVIVEGLFIFEDKKYKDLYYKKLFLEISNTTFFGRRNIEQRWGEEPDWYVQHVWDSFQSNRKRPTDTVKVSGESPINIESLSKLLKLA
ncbi:MAG: nicotinamide/nicotinate riboside kinase [Cyclobacteriaceae bacterium]|jgi:nicotinamide/nicotinate riboside kinase